MTIYTDMLISTLAVIVIAIIAELVKRYYRKQIKDCYDYYQKENHELQKRIFDLERELKRCKNELKDAELHILQHSDRN